MSWTLAKPRYIENICTKSCMYVCRWWVRGKNCANVFSAPDLPFALYNRRGQRAGAVWKSSLKKSIYGSTKGSWSEIFPCGGNPDYYSISSFKKGHSDGWYLPSLWCTLPLCSSFAPSMTACQPSSPQTTPEWWLRCDSAEHTKLFGAFLSVEINP